jgi:hypothetical protein
LKRTRVLSLYLDKQGGLVVNDQTKPGKTRSPNYPAISLGEAIQRLKTIYDKQQRYPATREVLAQLLGYKGLNGASATIVSALSKYGLLEGHGDSLRVSELGQDLALHRKGDAEYTEALRTSAFMPAFFQEMSEQYPSGLPHDHSLRAALVKRGFNPKAIDYAVRSYRDTMEFLDAETGEFFAEFPEQQVNVSARQPRAVGEAREIDQNVPSGQRAIAIPLSQTQWASLQAPFPLTEALWNQMLAVLNAMKPALVASAESSTWSPGTSSIESDGSEL